MTKLILTCTLQFCVLFSYTLCASHMTGYHYAQALYQSGCVQCITVLSVTAGFCHKIHEHCSLLGYYAVSGGNLLTI